MNQFVENTLSEPPSPLCCKAFRNTSPWNISIQPSFMVMSIGVGVELGSALVPHVACCVIASTNVLGCSLVLCIPDISCASGPQVLSCPKLCNETNRHAAIQNFANVLGSIFHVSTQSD